MNTNNTIQKTEKLTPEEKKLLKSEIKRIWSEFPTDMKKFILETKKEKLKALYMIQDWAKDHGHETILGLISRRIVHKEEKIKQMESELEK